MADATKIEWTDATWNPITGCSVVSPGCTNCYAMRLAGTRLRHHPSRAGLTRETKAGPVWNGEVRTNWDWMDQPLRWSKPRMIFVCAHSDLFHPAVSEEDIAMVYGVMIAAHHLRGHTFQVLTKRPERARELLTSVTFWEMAMSIANSEIMERTDPLARRSDDAQATCGEYRPSNPPPGIWLGASAEDQARANQRVPELLATPAAVHFVSAEPLLGPIDFSYLQADSILTLDALTGLHADCDGGVEGVIDTPDPKLDWIIVGGEAGRGARPMHPDWVRQIRDQCASAGTAFFFKQHGDWIAFYDRDRDDPEWRRCPSVDNQRGRGAERYHNLAGGAGFHGERVLAMRNVGKAKAGRLLDGVEHNAIPNIPSASSERRRHVF